jgi:hypothetical protein
VELAIGIERKQSKNQSIVLDHHRQCRDHLIGRIAGNRQIHLVDVEQLRIDPGHRRGIALVVVIDELHRPAQQSALGVDVLGPNLHRQQAGLADHRQSARQCHAQADRNRLRRTRG